MSRWAYKSVLQFKHDGYTRTGWQKEVDYQCLKVNGDFPTPMLPNEVKCIAKINWGMGLDTLHPSNKAAWHAAQNHRRKTTTNAGRKSTSTIILIED